MFSRFGYSHEQERSKDQELRKRIAAGKAFSAKLAHKWKKREKAISKKEDASDTVAAQSCTARASAAHGNGALVALDAPVVVANGGAPANVAPRASSRRKMNYDDAQVGRGRLDAHFVVGFDKIIDAIKSKTN